MSNLFIRDISILKENNDTNIILEEDFKEVINSFTIYAERRLKGYSVREIDSLATKAKAVNSEVSKREVLIKVDTALKAAKEKLAKPKLTDDTKKELRLQIQVLGELKNKVNSFKVIEPSDEVQEKEKTVINLDEL